MLRSIKILVNKRGKIYLRWSYFSLDCFFLHRYDKIVGEKKMLIRYCEMRINVETIRYIHVVNQFLYYLRWNEAFYNLFKINNVTRF